MLLELSDTRSIASATVDPSFHADVIAGLSRRPKSLPARWFYDLHGSSLFEKITELPEYYPTRTERGILARVVPEIASLTGPGRALVEFGSGSSAKTTILLSALEPFGYVPIDISGEFLRAAAEALRQQFPWLPIQELEGDFTNQLTLPGSIDGVPRLGFFPGSTIGNLLARDAVDLLRAMATTLGEGAMLLIGIDRVKSRDTLIAAYDDAQGVTAEFNLNLLRRVNRELRGSIPLDAFAHRVRWNEHESRIEMHLEARRNIEFTVAGEPFSMVEGETIHTENSLKYGLRDAHYLLRAGGWSPIADWTDHREYFSLFLAEVARAPGSP